MKTDCGEDGSAKETEWALVERQPLTTADVFTDGLNSFSKQEEKLAGVYVSSDYPIFFSKKLEQIYYCGAGCQSYEKTHILGASLVAQFKTPIQVEKVTCCSGNAVCLNAKPALPVSWELAPNFIFMTEK